MRHKREAYKQKQIAFDKAFRVAKREHLRKTEIEIESMIGCSGKEMWNKLNNIGSGGSKYKGVPDAVIIDGHLETNREVISQKWVDDFASLYMGIPRGTPGYNDSFLDEISMVVNQAGPRLCEMSNLNTDSLNSRSRR